MLRVSVVGIKLHVRRVRLRLQLLHQLVGFCFRFLTALASELDQQPSFAFRQQSEVVLMEMLLTHILEEQVVDSFERDRSRVQQIWNSIGGGVNVGISKNEQGTEGRIVDEAQLGFQNRDQSPFRADERAG